MESSHYNMQSLAALSMYIDAQSNKLFLQLTLRLFTFRQRICLLNSKSGNMILTVARNNMAINSYMESVLTQPTEVLFNMLMNLQIVQIVLATLILKTVLKDSLLISGHIMMEL
jgi:hypothetical protein